MTIHKMFIAGGSCLLLMACDVNDGGNLIPQYAVAPSVSVDQASGALVCSFQTGSSQLLNIRMDVFAQSAMTLQVQARNNAQDIDIPISTNPPQEIIMVDNSIQPLRFDYRWECDSTGFTADQGALYVPAFNPVRPFCVDNRDDATSDFVGFDIISASGGAIPAGGEGLIETRIVTPQLAEGIRDTFDLAIQADLCCQEVQGCENLDMADTTNPNTNCGLLQQIFDRVAGANVYSANSLDDVTRWRPFAAYTNSNGTGKTPVSYPMRLRGRYEGITPSGDFVTSTEYTQDIGFCQGCGLSLAAACLDQ